MGAKKIKPTRSSFYATKKASCQEREEKQYHYFRYKQRRIIIRRYNERCILSPTWSTILCTKQYRPFRLFPKLRRTDLSRSRGPERPPSINPAEDGRVRQHTREFCPLRRSNVCRSTGPKRASAIRLLSPQQQQQHQGWQQRQL